jgi:heme-degrading monooxygenase HmoA
MVVTMLEASVHPDRVEELERRFQELSADLPPMIRETFLVRGADEARHWRIITVWSSQEGLREMQEQTRAAGTKPGGVLVFEAAGATPTLTVFDVRSHAAR